MISASRGWARIFSIRRAICGCWKLSPHRKRTAPRIDAVTHFSDVNLGKGVVFAKDTPNFIANRIGTFSVLNVMRLMQEMDLSIEEVDALTGDAVGWPKSATFRTIDLVGLDILGHVVGNMEKSGGQENPPHPSPLPDFYKQMLERKWLGDKTKGGFYKKSVGRAPSPANAGSEDERLALDWKTLEYRPRQKPKFPALDMAKNIEDPGARLRTLLGLEGSPQKGDKAGAFLWSVLSDLWNYSCQSRSRNFRFHRRDRSRHAPRLQLEAGPLRTVGRGRG